MKRLLRTSFFVFFFLLASSFFNNVFAEVTIKLPSNSLPAEQGFNVTIEGKKDRTTVGGWLWGEDCYWVKLRNVTVGEFITVDAQSNNDRCKGAPGGGKGHYFYLYNPENGPQTIPIPALPAGEYKISVYGVSNNSVSSGSTADVSFLLTGTASSDESPITGSESGLENITAEVVSVRNIGNEQSEGSASSTELSQITGSTYEVKVKFSGFSSDSDFKVCPVTAPVGACREKEEAKSFHTDIKSTDGVIEVILCGDGTNKAKIMGPGKSCNSKKDYFHEGHNYGVHLFANDTTIVHSFYFYIYHRFPIVLFDNGLQIYADPNKHEDNPGIFITPRTQGGSTEISNPLKFKLHRLQYAGGEKRNGFFASIQGSNGMESYRCFNLSDQGATQEHSMGTQSGNRLPAGRYTLVIQQRVNAGDSKNPCQGGGFTYFKIPFVVSVDEHGEKTEIIANQIEADPDQIDSQKSPQETRFGLLPCAKGLDVNNKETTESDKIVKCLEFETAFGVLSTSPVGFIMTLGRWLLAIGTVAAFGFLLYAGFLIQTSRGDKEKISQAREIITSAVTGLIFLILSIAILEIIGVDILQLPGFSR